MESKTDVKFFILEGTDDEIMAFSPNENYFNSETPLKMCYNLVIGEHTPCHENYVKNLTPANEEQYRNLYFELLYNGFELNVL